MMPEYAVLKYVCRWKWHDSVQLSCKVETSESSSLTLIECFTLIENVHFTHNLMQQYTLFVIKIAHIFERLITS